MFWNGFITTFDSSQIFRFWVMIDFVLKIPSELGTDEFRNVEQWYPITSSVEEFNPKVSGLNSPKKYFLHLK